MMADRPPRVTIKRVEIAGYKSIADTQLDLHPINVLIGANGAGKSNFVSFFHMLAASLDARLDGYVGTQGGAEVFLHQGAKQTREIRCALRVQTKAGNGTLYQSLVFRAPDTLTYGPAHAPGGRGRDRSKELIFDDLCAVVEEEGGNHPGQLVYFGLRDGIGAYHFHDTSLTGPMRKSAEISDNARLHSDAGNLPAMLYLYRELEKKKKSEHPNKRYLGSAYARVRRMVKKFFPAFHDFVLKPERLNENRVLLRWRQEGSEHVFGPHQLSDGTLRAIALATLLLQPEKDLPSLIVIDEPELGLHPLGIELIAGLIRAVSLKCQVILATQSTTLLDFFDPEDIVVAQALRGVSRFQRLEREELTDWLRTYSVSELWQKNVIGGGPLP
jgi:predicted ATPase